MCWSGGFCGWGEDEPGRGALTRAGVICCCCCCFCCTDGDGAPSGVCAPLRGECAKRFSDGTAQRHDGDTHLARGFIRALLAAIAVAMATGESCPRAYRRPSCEDAMVDAECAGGGDRRWFGATVSCRHSAVDYGLWDVGGRCSCQRPCGARCCVFHLTVCRSQCRGGVGVVVWDPRPFLVKLQMERSPSPRSTKKKRSGVAADKGPPACRAGRPPPLQSFKAPWANGKSQSPRFWPGPGTGCGTEPMQVWAGLRQ